MNDKGRTMTYVIIAIAIVILIAVGTTTYIVGANNAAKNLEGQILIKQNEIVRLNVIISEQKDIAKVAKEDALKYGKMVAASNAEVKKLKKQVAANREAMENIKPSESVRETVDRLDKLGIKPEVKCGNKDK